MSFYGNINLEGRSDSDRGRLLSAGVRRDTAVEFQKSENRIRGLGSLPSFLPSHYFTVWIPSVTSAINFQFLEHSIDVQSLSTEVSGNLGKSLNLSESRFSHLYKRDNNSIVLISWDG